MSETEHHINESADKIVLKTKLKRETGTRDEDRIEVKVKGDDTAETAEKLHKTIQAIGRRETVNELRETQPSENDGA